MFENTCSLYGFLQLFFNDLIFQIKYVHTAYCIGFPAFIWEIFLQTRFVIFLDTDLKHFTKYWKLVNLYFLNIFINVKQSMQIIIIIRKIRILSKIWYIYWFYQYIIWRTSSFRCSNAVHKWLILFIYIYVFIYWR